LPSEHRTVEGPAAAELAARTAGDDFDHYPSRNDDAPGGRRDREATLALVEELIRRHAPAGRAAEVLVELETGLERWRGHLFNDVNPVRPDYSGDYHAKLEAVLARTRHSGTVHLELGTWTAFPRARTEALRADEGLAELIRTDFDLSYEIDVAADATALPFRTNSLDRVASNSVFEHVAYPHQIIAESFRVLKPGGVMVVAMPFVFNLHGYPADYVRLTPSFFERICREAGFETVVADVEPASGLYYTLHNSAKSATVDLDHEDADAAVALHVATMLLLGMLIPMDRRFRNNARHWFHSLLVHAVKPGAYVPSHRATGDLDVPFADRCGDLLGDPGHGVPLLRRGDSLFGPRTLRRYVIRDGVPDFTTANATSGAHPVRRAAGRAMFHARRCLGR
jgi:SAM-dependent methyltransferase